MSLPGRGDAKIRRKVTRGKNCDEVRPPFPRLRNGAQPNTLRMRLQHEEGWQNGYCTSLENWRPQGLGGSSPSPSVHKGSPEQINRCPFGPDHIGMPSGSACLWYAYSLLQRRFPTQVSIFLNAPKNKGGARKAPPLF